VHRLDAGRLYRLALEKGEAGASYHAIAEESVTVRDIAEAIGRRLNVPVVSKSPEEAAGHFGWLAHFAGMDAPGSSKLTQQRLGWRVTASLPGMIADLDELEMT
jgi:nucleoside-diphosphate-sugar epimerase